TASLAVTQKLAAKETRTFTFVLAWHFPNRRSWTLQVPPAPAADGPAAGMTPFAQYLQLSPFLPLQGTVADLDLPADLSALGLKTRMLSSSQVAGFCEIHKEIIARPSDAHEALLLVSRIHCPQAMRVDLLLGYDGPVKVWADGREVFVDLAGTNPAEKDDARIPLELGEGEHQIAIALDTNKGNAWGVYVRYQRTDLPRKATAKFVPLPALLDGLPNQAAAPAQACCEGGSCGPTGDPDWVGNYYCTRFRDAWDAAERTGQHLEKLEAKTVEFVGAVCDSDLPEVVKEAALFNVSTLRTTTCFRTADGYFFGWEGCGDRGGCCHGSCTHVWNYEQATPYLFGGLSRLAREAEFLHATAENGLMSFRINLPLTRALDWKLAAADGQMGTIMRLYRDWRLSGDPAMLKQLWPKAKKAMEFCWIPGGWDADQDGVMEGCQHNTMDVEYYGPNGQMGIWYLGALRAEEEMAKAMGDTEFAARCRGLFERGRAWIDTHLFNGQFYEHEIRPPKSAADIAPGLKHGSMGSANLQDPDLQLGAACLVDQLVGQFLAHVCDLGHLVEPKNVNKTLASLMKYNFKTDMRGHFNHLRTFALGNESAMLMATYPLGRRPRRPFPYFNEVMTGFEYAAGVHMLYEGLEKDGLKVIKAIRDRYDGRRRSPFDEAECGHHYARAMASWAGILALTGFDYSAVTKTMRFAAPAKSARWFWSTGYAWGVVEINRAGPAAKVALRVLFGSVALEKLELRGLGEATLPVGKTLIAGDSVAFSIGQPKAAPAPKPAKKKAAAKPQKKPASRRKTAARR
ncbi:MAG: GH116 family glycosyl hydrolase, partial [Planctomycetota bacterium]|nr:GH116 family glycosyl hydrolase [Planctomycetota bacterium]